MNVHDSDLKEIILIIWKYRQVQDYSEMDNYLRSFDVSTTEPLLLVCLLRTSFVSRFKLQTWNMLLTKTRERLIQLGLNHTSILHGLKNYE